MKPNIIVMGASAGGIPALGEVLQGLPRNLRAAVLIVQHTSQGPGRLAEVLGRMSALPVRYPKDGEAARNGQVYVAPPDLHMLLERRKIRLVRGPRENHHRPGIDALFRSAALNRGSQTIGVVLTGALDDGTSGLRSIKNNGGVAVVQDPEEAEFPYMPRSALKHVEVDHVERLEGMASLLATLTETKMKSRRKTKGNDALETAAAAGLARSRTDLDRIGTRSSLSCPECKGALWEIEESGLLRFRCHIGHGYTAEGLLVDQEEEVELALGHALRALEDRADLAKRLVQRAKARKQKHNQIMYESEVREAGRHAETLRKTLLLLRPRSANKDRKAQP